MSMQQTLKDEGFVQKDIFAECGKRWKELTDEEKEPFVALNLSDKKKEADRKAMVEAKGYFLMDDGTKSTDPSNAKLFKEKKKNKKQ